jgi:hypothetical protein
MIGILWLVDNDGSEQQRGALTVVGAAYQCFSLAGRMPTPWFGNKRLISDAQIPGER